MHHKYPRNIFLREKQVNETNRFNHSKASRSTFSAWLILGAIVLLLPLFIFMTWQGVAMQRDLTTRLLVEKGDALIRSVEAGIRTGIGFQWGDFQIQKFLIETAQQPGIDYFVITDAQDRIVADSDPSQVGEVYKVDAGAPPAGKIRWRRVANPSGADTFEVYRLLHSPEGGSKDTWIIYVGLDMGPFLNVYEQNRGRLIVTALILLLIGLVGVVTLILTQNYRAARSSLSKIKIFSDTLIDNLPLGLIGLDREGRITFFNRVASNLLSQSTTMALGQLAQDILPAAFQAILNELRDKQGIVQRQVDWQMGAVLHQLDILGAIWKDDEGAMQGSLLLLHDMTELRSLQRKIERSRRLASVGSLAAGVAHEIRNPLSSIKGFATYFRERYRDNPEDVANANIMIHEVERLNRVIGQLLEFSRPLDLVKARTAVDAMVTRSLKLIEARAAEQRVRVDVSVSEEIPNILVDADKIHQVLLNLFINALESMQKGGVLSVEAARIVGGRLEILITDTGVGIEKEKLVHIFDPYYTTKSSGTGLGLAIVHKIVEAHDGSIRIDSVVDRGTSVRVVLPIGV